MWERLKRRKRRGNDVTNYTTISKRKIICKKTEHGILINGSECLHGCLIRQQE